MNPLALQDVDNEMLRDSDEYLRKHKIIELFEVSQKFNSFLTVQKNQNIINKRENFRLKINL